MAALGFRRGRWTNSPLQFGQTFCIPDAQPGQNVHSYEQMYASSPAAIARLHFSHPAFISRAMSCLARLAASG